MSITSKVLLANGLLPTSLHGNEDRACGLTRTRPGTDTHALPMENYVIAGMGNYVIADPTNLGNFMIADTTAGLIRIARSTESFRFCRVNVTSSRWISVAMEIR